MCDKNKTGPNTVPWGHYPIELKSELFKFEGKDSPPAVSLHGRPKNAKPDNTPAPGDYDPDKAEKVIHDNSPKYTFGLKTNVGKPVDTPGMYFPFSVF